MNAKSRKWAPVGIAAVLALITTIVIVAYLQNVHRPVVAPQIVVSTESVVVARTNIAERAVIRPDELAVVQVASSARHPHAVGRIEDAAGRIALGPIFENEQVIQDMLAPAGANDGISYILPRGDLAMSIPVNEVVDVAGFVFPGDRVDVIGTVNDDTNRNISKIFLQNIPVLAVAQSVEQTPGGQPKVTTSATLALTPDQAEKLAQVDNNGKIRLALRAAGSQQRVQTTGETTSEALGANPAPVTVTVARAPVYVFPAPQRGLPLPPVAPRPWSVEIWRSTTESNVNF